MEPFTICDSSSGEIYVMSIAEAAEFLHVSLSTAYRMVRAGELQAFKIRGKWRTTNELCEKYIEEQVRHQVRLCQAKGKI